MTEARQHPSIPAAYRERIDRLLAEHAGAVEFPFSGHMFARRGFNPAVLTLDDHAEGEEKMISVERLTGDEAPRVGRYLAYGPRVVVTPVGELSPHRGVIRPVRLTFEMHETRELALLTRDLTAEDQDEIQGRRPVLDIPQLGRLKRLCEARVDALLAQGSSLEDDDVAQTREIVESCERRIEELANTALARELGLDFELCDQQALDRLLAWLSRAVPRSPGERATG